MAFTYYKTTELIYVRYCTLITINASFDSDVVIYVKR